MRQRGAPLRGSQGHIPCAGRGPAAVQSTRIICRLGRGRRRRTPGRSPSICRPARGGSPSRKRPGCVGLPSACCDARAWKRSLPRWIGLPRSCDFPWGPPGEVALGEGQGPCQ
eukprot:294265-Pyramimonas_sp.AAC.1